MAIAARFRRGGTTIDLMTSPYLASNVVPPGSQRTWQVADGVVNNSNGGELVGSKLLDSQFDLSVRVYASTPEQAKAAANELAAFCNTSVGDTLWFDFKPNASLPEPLWGQFGAYLRYEVITADVQINDLYSRGRVGSFTGVVFFCAITMRVKPAVGQKQRLANANGAVVVDRYIDGCDHGLRIMQTVTNKMTSPIFAMTFAANPWTAASLTRLETAKSGYVLNGYSAILVWAAAANGTCTQSINAGNVNTHAFKCYVRRPDNAAVTSADCQIYYNAALTTTFTPLRGGWYELTATAVGINAAADVGIQVKAGRAVYLSGFMMGETALPVEFIHGDMLGCEWSGTKLASTTTASSGRIQLTAVHDTIQAQGGSIAVIWKPEEDNALTGNRYLFSCGAGMLSGYYNPTDDKFYLTDGANTISTAAQTFATSDALHLVFTWGSNGLNIFKNGTNAATGGTYTSQVIGGLVIGSDVTPANRCRGKLLGFTIYETALTSTQVQAVYDAALPLIAANLQVDCIPFLWTLDGDGVCDNITDTSGSTGAPHAAYSVIDSVPGTAAAGLEILGQITGDFGTANRNGIFMSMLDLCPYIDARYLYMDVSSGGGAGLTYSGGFYGRATITTSFAYIERMQLYRQHALMLANRDIALLTRIGNDATGNLQIGMLIEVSGSLQTAYKSVTIATPQFMNRVTLKSTFPDLRDQYLDEYGISSNAYIKLVAKRSTGSGTLDCDFFQIMPRPFLRIRGETLSSAYGVFVYDSTRKIVRNTDGGAPSNADLGLIGDYIEPYPRRSNIVYSFIGSDTVTYAASYNDTLTYSRVYITPRWSLL